MRLLKRDKRLDERRAKEEEQWRELVERRLTRVESQLRVMTLTADLAKADKH